MQKFKLATIVCIIMLFSLFAGFQINTYGNASFLKGFIVTGLFGVLYLVFQTIYFIAMGQKLQLDKSNTLPNPLDIWLVMIPMVFLMMISYVWLEWHVVEVFICTTISLTGMLFGNSLGRGKDRWLIYKSLPFLFGCIVSIVYAILFGRMM